MVETGTIYIADDDPSIREILSVILTDKGYNVILSPDGLSLQYLDIIPDLILLDIRMSETNGSDLCRSYKQNKRTADVPVVLISANLDVDEIAVDCGADEFLSKPFELKDILELTQKYMLERNNNL
jgi:CheY-like chemotaxis protein